MSSGPIPRVISAIMLPIIPEPARDAMSHRLYRA